MKYEIEIDLDVRRIRIVDLSVDWILKLYCFRAPLTGRVDLL